MYEHVKVIDLFDNGVGYECVILNQFDNGDIAYIQLNTLDSIDLDRLKSIVFARNAHDYPLWDLMSQHTLRNGENALTYFDQMAMVKTISGEHISTRVGGRGFTGATVMPKEQTAEQTTNVQSSIKRPKSKQVKRGPGRPPKK